MAQRYKVRLGDGTVLSVDSDGLRTWAGDSRATAQAIGSWRWQPLQEVLAEEEAAARLSRALVPPQPREGAAPPEFDLGDLLAEPAPASKPTLQALADDPMSAGESGRAAPAGPDDLPVIPMKPPDDEPAFESAWSANGEPEDDEPAEDDLRQDRLDGPLLTVLEKGGGLLSRILSHLAPLVARLTARRPRTVSEPVDLSREEDTPPAATPAVLALAEDPVSPRDAGDDEAREDDRPTVGARVAGWMHGLGARLRRPAPEEPLAPEPAPAVVRTPPAPAVQPAVEAPVPVSKLPVLRFRESREPREREDVYEEEGPSLRERLQPAWLWTRRILTAGVLVAALAYAVRERDVWFPRTAELGQTVFTEIDRQVLSREREAERQRALADAGGRLPGLAPQTIELLFSRSPTGVAEAGEVFQLAREAADRGLATLPAAEAEELRALERELLGTLSRTEAERVREYDRTRARRAIFPFENPHVMDLFARGARALPPERLGRLQALTHKAVAAGLDRPERTPSSE
jgi:hypothetical protein